MSAFRDFKALYRHLCAFLCIYYHLLTITPEQQTTTKRTFPFSCSIAQINHQMNKHFKPLHFDLTYKSLLRHNKFVRENKKYFIALLHYHATKSISIYPNLLLSYGKK